MPEPTEAFDNLAKSYEIKQAEKKRLREVQATDAQLERIKRQLQNLEDTKLADLLSGAIDPASRPGHSLQPSPWELDVDDMYCSGADRPLHGHTWTDRQGNLVGECGVCLNLAPCYVNDNKAMLNDHLAKPRGHRCSECDGPIWRDDEYLCVLCIQGGHGG